MDVLVRTCGSPSLDFAYVLAQVGLGLVLFGARHLVHAPRAGADRASRRAADALGKARRARLRLLRRHARGANAATAFQTMGIRLRRSIQQRTEMLPASATICARRSPHEAVAGAPARFAGDQGAGDDRGRHGAHDRRLSRLRARRGRRGSRPGRLPRSWKRGGRRTAHNANVEVGWRGDMDVELRALAISAA